MVLLFFFLTPAGRGVTRSAELWYMSSFPKLFNHEGESRTNELGVVDVNHAVFSVSPLSLSIPQLLQAIHLIDLDNRVR